MDIYVDKPTCNFFFRSPRKGQTSKWTDGKRNQILLKNGVDALRMNTSFRQKDILYGWKKKHQAMVFLKGEETFSKYVVELKIQISDHPKRERNFQICLILLVGSWKQHCMSWERQISSNIKFLCLEKFSPASLDFGERKWEKSKSWNH